MGTSLGSTQGFHRLEAHTPDSPRGTSLHHRAQLPGAAALCLNPCQSATCSPSFPDSCTHVSLRLTPPSSPSPSRSGGEQSASEDASDESTLDGDSYSSSEEDSPHKAPQPRHPKALLDPATAIVANGHWGAVHLAHPISDTHWRTACG